MATHILLAIDGTGSASWRDPSGQNSHVYRFYNDAQTPYRLYLDGPSTLGTELMQIIETGTTWILALVAKLTQNHTPLSEIKIDLVGHSRGGVAVIKVANNLENLATYQARTGYRTLSFINGLPVSLRVNFMGLYDAVNRTIDTFIDTELRNVDHLIHARRLNTAMLRVSRPSFGNVDTRGALYFDTSHGGVGGDPGFFAKIEAGNDLYCNALSTLAAEENPQPGASTSKSGAQGSFRISEFVQVVQSPADSLYSALWLDETDRREKLKKYWQASVKVDHIIRINAKEAGIGLSTSTHVPWHRREQLLGKRLSDLLGMKPQST